MSRGWSNSRSYTRGEGGIGCGSRGTRVTPVRLRERVLGSWSGRGDRADCSADGSHGSRGSKTWFVGLCSSFDKSLALFRSRLRYCAALIQLLSIIECQQTVGPLSLVACGRRGRKHGAIACIVGRRRDDAQHFLRRSQSGSRWLGEVRNKLEISLASTKGDISSRKALHSRCCRPCSNEMWNDGQSPML